MDFSDLSIKHMDFTNEEWGMGMPGNGIYPQSTNCNREHDAKPWDWGYIPYFQKNRGSGGFRLPKSKNIIQNLELIADF
jgi:hypothetical protein